ncbi:DUF305 domain-containing protein [Paeniglutamicibacter kerguelensis]|uniref:Uncharacterized protein (DUF305 family) n=1 Tax=Paeniglutamicibacter kerguelensis TaxID=254788 RepID=A0ABS4X8E9_9MICC|nr:DUF305 domain-containing protein [Paeniglutamicibacter kerguelensis]MBP2384741.1 uncharacterized protein (DUF305 family) [Paeniglutamicibacter kerguelensis]
MSDSKTSRSLIIALAALVIAVGFGGWMLGTTNPHSTFPSDASPEAGFARDMQTHHQQAVQLSMIIRDNSTNAAVRSFAYDIALTQQQQSGQMYAWIELWGLPQTGESMTWMNDLLSEDPSHASHGTPTSDKAHTMASMGMATQEQIKALTDVRGAEADRQFLTLMIAHHMGGVEMAQAYLDRGHNAMVRTFAQKIVMTQEAEITALTQLLNQLD